jgi:hypothetical protein
MRRHLPFIIASLMCLPFLVYVLIFLLALTVKASALAVGWSEALGYILIVGFFWFSVCPAVTLAVLALVSTSVIAAWLQKTKTKMEIVFTGIYSVTMLLHIGYAIWCLVTKQVFDL